MIGRITGRLAEKNPPQILIDVNGVGYELEVPMSTFYGLPALGQNVSLATHLAVREDGHFLYGFATEDERAAFRQLLKVAGIGARTALAVLSGLSVHDLAQAVALQESGRLVKIPGIGKKTAERIVVELRDKVGFAPGKPGATGPTAAGAHAPVSVSSAQQDALDALVALGFKATEADKALRAAIAKLGPDAPAEKLIRSALGN